jgi:hypothetical protein
MARPREADPRFDLRGGVNSTFGADVLDVTEARQTKNGRILMGGNVQKRAGSQRLHDTAIGSGAAVKGLFQWDDPLGKRIVAVAGGNFYHKSSAATDFTAIVSTLSTVNRVTWAPYRTGAAIKLLFADGALRSWDGTTLTTVIAGAPAARQLAIYKVRGFATDGTKTLYGSKVGNPTLWGAPNGGFTADVETYDSEPLNGIIVVGSSLLLCKEDNIARFTGVDTTNVRIDIESEGVSREVGLIAPNTLVGFEEFAFLMTDRGPYIASEAGLKEIGLKVTREFDFANKAAWGAAEAVHNRRRKEIWLTFPQNAEVRNDTTWIYSYRTDTWAGPFRFPFSLMATARLELVTAEESSMAGGNDGFVRDLDVVAIGAKDDVLRAGTGGANVVLDLTYPDLLGGAPDIVKSMRSKQKVEADLGAAGSLEAYWSSELSAGSSVFMATRGAGVKDYRWKWANAKGARLVYGLRESTAEIVTINGVLPNFALGRKARS